MAEVDEAGEITGRLHVDGEGLARRRVPGLGPTIVWLGGFHSEMSGSKAQALANWARRAGRDFLRFDYYGHGQSGGQFAFGTISRWRNDVLAVLDCLTSGPVVLVGSSMGGWLACLAAVARPERVKAMVLIAPAADFTETLLKPSLAPEALRELATVGQWRRPSTYTAEGEVIAAALLDDGARWSILGSPIQLDKPVWIIQGGNDIEVPWRHALRLAEAIASKQIIFTLVSDGDHRLSRPSDISRMIAAVDEVVV